MKTVRPTLNSLFYFAALFPFVSPYPIQTDTQPLCFGFAIMLLFARMLGKGLKLHELGLLLAVVLLFLRLDPNYSGGVAAGKYLSLFAGVVIFSCVRYVSDRNAFAVLSWSVILYFVYTCLIYLSPDVFLTIQGYFVRHVNVAEGNALAYRGAPTFSTEPGLLGGVLVFFMLEIMWFHSKKICSTKEATKLAVLVGINIILTKSGTGYVYAMLLASLFVFTNARMFANRKGLVLIVGGVVALGAVLMSGGAGIDNRGYQILVSGITKGQFLTDTSILKRVYDLAVGFYSLPEHPFGVGANRVDAVFSEIAFRNSLVREVDWGNQIGLVSGLSWILIAYGVFGAAMLAYIFLILSAAPLANKVFALLFLSLSFSPAFPAIWVLLARRKATASANNEASSPAKTTNVVAKQANIVA